MATRELLSEAQRTAFERFPEMDVREMVRHFTLSEADLAVVSLRRGSANRLGFAVQLCLLRYPGRPLRTGEIVPYPALQSVTEEIARKDGRRSGRRSARNERESGRARPRRGGAQWDGVPSYLLRYGLRWLVLGKVGFLELEVLRSESPSESFPGGPDELRRAYDLIDLGFGAVSPYVVFSEYLLQGHLLLYAAEDVIEDLLLTRGEGGGSCAAEESLPE